MLCFFLPKRILHWFSFSWNSIFFIEFVAYWSLFVELVACWFLFVKLDKCVISALPGKLSHWFSFLVKLIFFIEFVACWSLFIGAYCILSAETFGCWFSFVNPITRWFFSSWNLSLGFSARETDLIHSNLLHADLFSWSLLHADFCSWNAINAGWFFSSWYFYIDSFLLVKIDFPHMNLLHADLCSWSLLRADFCFGKFVDTVWCTFSSWNFYIGFPSREANIFLIEFVVHADLSFVEHCCVLNFFCETW